MSGQVFDPRICRLGEGPMWHPGREQLFWFDILGRRLLSVEEDGPKTWQFEEHVSAAGWTGRDTLLIASETSLFHFDLLSGNREPLASLEADNRVTRSNDGRADPWGGFWIGTMGKQAEPGLGAIYRWYQGELVCVFDNITISNAICFSPDRRYAYFTDTPTRQIMRQSLDEAGWPKGPASVFIDLRAEELNPDGAVVDAKGCLWNAQWGASRVARYDPDGVFLEAMTFPASQVSCPAFGGSGLGTLFATSAVEGLQDPVTADGQTFSIQATIAGQAEHRVLV